MKTVVKNVVAFTVTDLRESVALFFAPLRTLATLFNIPRDDQTRQ